MNPVSLLSHPLRRSIPVVLFLIENISIQAAVLNGFKQMVGLDVVRGGEVGDGAGDF